SPCRVADPRPAAPDRSLERGAVPACAHAVADRDGTARSGARRRVPGQAPGPVPPAVRADRRPRRCGARGGGGEPPRRRGRTTDQRRYEELLADAGRVLTEAASRATTRTDRNGREHRQPADFAEFVTHAVAGAAANIGGVEQILAGRPGSWEADHVRQMLHS